MLHWLSKQSGQVQYVATDSPTPHAIFDCGLVIPNNVCNRMLIEPGTEGCSCKDAKMV